jgi:hypothetical protein
LPSFGNFGRREAHQRQPGTGTIIGGLVFGRLLSDQTPFWTRVNRDGFTGLDYADQRYYSSVLGRFGTPDPYQPVEWFGARDLPNRHRTESFSKREPGSRSGLGSKLGCKVTGGKHDRVGGSSSEPERRSAIAGNGGVLQSWTWRN